MSRPNVVLEFLTHDLLRSAINLVCGRLLTVIIKLLRYQTPDVEHFLE